MHLEADPMHHYTHAAATSSQNKYDMGCFNSITQGMVELPPRQLLQAKKTFAKDWLSQNNTLHASHGKASPEQACVRHGR